jgi:hypothetical protein
MLLLIGLLAALTNSCHFHGFDIVCRVSSITVMGVAGATAGHEKRNGWLTLSLDGCSMSIDIGSSGGGGGSSSSSSSSSDIIDVAAVRARLVKLLTKSNAILAQLQASCYHIHHRHGLVAC